MKDYLITLTVKNNIMLNKMKENGFNTAASLSMATNVSQSMIGSYLNLKEIPFSRRKNEEFKESIVKISKTLKMLPEDLFPEQHLRKVLNKNKATLEMSKQEVGNILEYNKDPQNLLEFKETEIDIKMALAVLTRREQAIIDFRFGVSGRETKTLQEIGDILGLSRNRICQIEAKALRKLKYNAARGYILDGYGDKENLVSEEKRNLDRRRWAWNQ